jgi:hypothetical protein
VSSQQTPVLARFALGFAVPLLLWGCQSSTLRSPQDATAPSSDAKPSKPSDAGTDAAAEAMRCSQGDCPAGEVCVAQQCVPEDEDRDGDGFSAGVDCDDTDDAVGTTARRQCSSSCATGFERCVMGQWQPCDAPEGSECNCTGNERRELDCARCGTQAQRCEQGNWQNEGQCMGQGSCSPGSVELGGDCGQCGTRRRTCLESCEWGAWQCVDQGACPAGEQQTESESCGRCDTGTRTRTRSCTDACSWGTWGSWGSCTGESGCEPYDVEQQTESCSTACGSGSHTRTRTCTSSCGWGSWGSWGSCDAPQPDPESCNLQDDDCDGQCDESAGCRTTVYRAYNPDRSSHLYTTDYSEASSFGNVEGSFEVYDSSAHGELVALHRCYFSADGTHVLSTDSDCEGGINEGRVGYIGTSEPDCGNTVQLFRLYSASRTDRLMTTDPQESNSAVDQGYQYEGVTGWVWGDIEF